MEVLLGNTTKALVSLKSAIDQDRNYCLKADTDRDFGTIKPQLETFFKKLHELAKINAEKAINESQLLLDEYIFISDEAKNIKQELILLLNQAKSKLSDGTYFDFLDTLLIPASLQKRIQELFLPSEVINVIKAGTVNGFLGLSPDGRYVLARENGIEKHATKILVYNSATGKPVSSIDCCDATRAVFSPDGKYIVFDVFFDQHSEQIQLFELPSGKIVTTLQGDNPNKTTFCFSPDSAYLASAQSDGTISVWDLANGGSPLKTFLISPTDNILFIRGFFSDNQYLLIAEGGVYPIDRSENIRKFFCCSINTGEVTTRFVPDDDNLNYQSYSYAIKADDNYLAIEYSDATVIIWSVPFGKKLVQIKIPMNYSLLEFSPDGKSLITIESPPEINTYGIIGFQPKTQHRILANKPRGGNRMHPNVYFTAGKQYLVAIVLDMKNAVLGFLSVQSGQLYKSVPLKDSYETLEASSVDGNVIVTNTWRSEFRIIGQHHIVSKKQIKEMKKQERNETIFQQEKQHHADKLKNHRLQNKICLSCGNKLSFFEKFTKKTICKKCS